MLRSVGEREQNVYRFLIEAAKAGTTFQGTGPLEQRMPEAIVWAGGLRARMFHNSGWPVTISLTILGCSEHGDIHVNCGHYLFERAEFTNGVVRPRAGYVTLAFGPDGKRSVFVVDPAAKAFEHESYGDFNWGESVRSQRSCRTSFHPLVERRKHQMSRQQWFSTRRAWKHCNAN